MQCSRAWYKQSPPWAGLLCQLRVCVLNGKINHMNDEATSMLPTQSCICEGVTQCIWEAVSIHHTGRLVVSIGIFVQDYQAWVWARLLMQSTQSCITWAGEGGALAGKVQSCADIEFYLDIDPESGAEMVHVAEPRPQRRQPEFLVKDISRFALSPTLHTQSLFLLSL